MSSIKIAVLADVPVSRLLGIASPSGESGTYATWLEALIPQFAQFPNADIHWITMWKGTNSPIEHRAYGQTFHILPRRRKMVAMLTGYWFESSAIHRVIESIQPNLVHAWGSEDAYGITGARYTRGPKLFSLQGCLSECLKQEPSPSWMLRLQQAFESRIIKGYSHGSGESLVAIAHLKRMNPEMSTRQIDYGVSQDFFDATWNPDPRANVLFAGSVTAAKGILELIEVISTPQLRNIDLYVAGDGNLFEDLNLHTPSNVHWLGRLPRAQLIEQMTTAWAVVIPTHADTGPSILKEARAMGLPIVTTTSAGASSYVKDSGCGMVIEARDREALAASILKICQSRDVCLQYGRAGWSHHRTLLHPRATAERFLELYREIWT